MNYRTRYLMIALALTVLVTPAYAEKPQSDLPASDASNGRACEDVADTAAWAARQRDAGVSLRETLDDMKPYSTKSQPGIRNRYNAAIRAAYTRATLPPEEIHAQVERECLGPAYLTREKARLAAIPSKPAADPGQPVRAPAAQPTVTTPTIQTAPPIATPNVQLAQLQAEYAAQQLKACALIGGMATLAMQGRDAHIPLAAVLQTIRVEFTTRGLQDNDVFAQSFTRLITEIYAKDMGDFDKGMDLVHAFCTTQIR